MAYDKETLEKLYKERNIAWDLGRPYKQLIDYVNKNKPCCTLDVGCGTGTDAICLAQNGFDVTGIDISKEAIKIAKSKARKARLNIKFVVCDALDMPFEDKKFEFVNDNGCFHLLDKSKWKRFIYEVSRVIKYEGRYLMKCFSDKEPKDPRIPYRLSKKAIREYFSAKFTILYIRDIVIEGILGNHKGYSILMEKKIK